MCNRECLVDVSEKADWRGLAMSASVTKDQLKAQTAALKLVCVAERQKAVGVWRRHCGTWIKRPDEELK